MFSIAQTESYTLPVSVEIVGANGQKKKQQFKAKFRRPTQEEVDELNARLEASAKAKVAALQGKGDEAEEVQEITDQEIIDKFMIGWEDVGDLSGQPVEYNESNLAALLSIYPTRKNIARTFLDSIYGAKAKN